MNAIVGFCLAGMAAGLFAQQNGPVLVQPAGSQPKVQFFEPDGGDPLKWIGQTVTEDDQLKEIMLRNDGDDAIVGIQLAWVVFVPKGCGVTGAGISRSEGQMGPYEARRLEPGQTTTVGPYHLSSDAIAALARQAHSPTAVARVIIYYYRDSREDATRSPKGGYPTGRLSPDQEPGRFGQEELIYPCQGKIQIEHQIEVYNRNREQPSFQPTEMQPKAHFISARATDSLKWAGQTVTEKDQLSRVVLRNASDRTITGFQLGWVVYLPIGCGVTEAGVPRRWTRLGPYEERRLKPGEAATVGPYYLSSESITALGVTAHSPAVVAQVGVYRVRYSDGTVTTSDFQKKGSFGPETEAYPCQTNKTVDANVLKTFTSPDGDFRFRYSQLLVRCRESDRQENNWEPGDSCEAYHPVCYENGIQGSHTLACIAYPRDKFEDAPTFEAAAFVIAEIDDAKTQSDCLKGTPDWDTEPRDAPGTKTIHGVKFKAFEVGEAGMNQGMYGDVYRNFHGNKCYELSIRSAYASPSLFDDINEFTKEDSNEVNGRLDQALESFRFLR
jgi:hypothetical protein